MPTPFKWGRRTYFVEAEVDACLLAYADNARNQPIRRNGQTLATEIGHCTFSKARAAWESLKNFY